MKSVSLFCWVERVISSLIYCYYDWARTAGSVDFE
jgi:hypothetical protein